MMKDEIANYIEEIPNKYLIYTGLGIAAVVCCKA